MKTTAVLFLAVSLAAATKETKVTAGEPSYDARTVSYHLGHAVSVNTQILWTTTLVFPPKERYMEFLCGDRDHWTINAIEGANYVAIHPDAIGLKTNLTVAMQSGNIYVFVLKDVSQDPGGHADTQVIVNLEDGAMSSALNGGSRFVLADKVDAYRLEAEQAKTELRAAQEANQRLTEQAQAKERERVATTARKHYRFDQTKAGKQPFAVEDIWSVDGKTYIRARPAEAPVVYEHLDGKPAMSINCRLDKGVYIADNVIRSGYLIIGKKQLDFRLDEGR